MTLPSLPEGFTVRPGTLDDLPEVTDLFNRANREIVGVDTHEPSFHRRLWTRPGFDPALDTRLVHSPALELAGAVFTNTDAPHVSPLFFGCVAPEHRDRGIGWFLTGWCEARCRERIGLAPEGARVSMHTWVFAPHAPSTELLSARGMKVTRHFVKMRSSMDTEPEAPVWPKGVELRPVDRNVQDRAICAANEAAFRDHWGYYEAPFEERLTLWKHTFDSDPLTDESLWFAAWDGEEVAGFLIAKERSEDDPEEGYLWVLGVRPAWRRRGLGLALLRAGVRALWDRGRRKAGLHADAENLTGAVRIYRKIGMEVVHVYDNWEKELRDGEELMVTGS